jgi:hypothetical protein
MKRYSLSMPLFVLLACIIGGCGHTNNLKDYKLAGSVAKYVSIVEPDASRVRIHIDNPIPGAHPVTDILVSAGSDVLSAEAQAKIDRAVRPTGVAAAVAKGIESMLDTYCSVRQPAGREDEPAFIVETRLLKCELHSTSSGIMLSVGAETSIIDRGTARTIWKDGADGHVPIRRTASPAPGYPGAATATSVINAIEFFKLTDEEIQDLIAATAEQAGRRIGESFRKDYSESH